jgi:hypothetical protein
MNAPILILTLILDAAFLVIIAMRAAETETFRQMKRRYPYVWENTTEEEIRRALYNRRM